MTAAKARMKRQRIVRYRAAAWVRKHKPKVWCQLVKQARRVVPLMRRYPLRRPDA